MFVRSPPQKLPPMTSPSTTIDQAILIGMISGGIIGICAWRSSRLLLRLFLFIASLSILAPSAIALVGKNPWLVDSRFRIYQFFYWNIRIGMSREEVFAEMNNWYPKVESHKPPTTALDTAYQLKFYMTQENPGEPQHEAILLKMLDGRVIGKEYIAD